MISGSGCCLRVARVFITTRCVVILQKIEVKKINDAEESSLYEGRMAFRSLSRKVRRHQGSRDGPCK